VEVQTHPQQSARKRRTLHHARKGDGPEFPGRARILPSQEWPAARALMRRKYWLLYLPSWSRKNEFLEIELTG
jgi:hypothetical protein